ncbi:MAG: DUF3530 family protein [Pseudomonadota bacterium]
MGTLTEIESFCTTRARDRHGRNHRLMAIVVLWIWSASSSAAIDLVREQTWATHLTATVPAAQRVWLGNAPERALALHLAATQTPIGGVILLHDTGGHPDQDTVIGPLRKRLPALGWTSLAVQMPIPDAAAKPANYPELLPVAYARIVAAIDFLHAQKVSIIVIAGYGLGAWATVNFLATQAKSRDDIAGLVLISLPSWPGLNPALDTTSTFAPLDLPRLDIFAELDLLEVRAAAPARIAAVRQASAADATKKDIPSFSVHSPQAQALTRNKYGPAGYRQRVVAGADHFYASHQEVLIKSITGWLRAYWRSYSKDANTQTRASSGASTQP